MYAWTWTQIASIAVEKFGSTLSVHVECCDLASKLVKTFLVVYFFSIDFE